MSDSTHRFGGVVVLELDASGPPILSRRDTTDLIGNASGAGADIVAIPTARQGADFFDLKTRILGEMVQVCVTYGLRLAFVGPMPEAVAGSKALRDFIYESNKGRSVWFVADIAELERRLAPVA
ncbi:MAG: DUF4180 domain-containing protein [Bauldia sp.]